MLRLLPMLFVLLFSSLVFASPPRPAVFKSDVGQVNYVLYSSTWYEITFDFKSRFYNCPNPNDEHGTWTGEIESYDVATATLVFREAYVVCKPDELPKAGPLHFVKMKFYRCPDTKELKASTEGGSWGRYEVSFR